MCDDLCMKKIMKDSLKYDKEIQKIARRIARGDSFLAEELRNEMHIAMLSMDLDQPKHILLCVVKHKAMDYRRSRAINNSYENTIKHFSLEAMQDKGFQIDTEGNVYEPEKDYSVDMEGFDDPEE